MVTVKIIENTIQANDLLSAAKEIKILHNGEEYKLKLTSNNKLILTK